MMQRTYTKTFRCLLFGLLGGGMFLARPTLAEPSSATNWVEAVQAEGSSVPKERDPDALSNSPATADENARSWLVQQHKTSPLVGQATPRSGPGTTTLLAFALLVLIAGGALWMRRRRRLLAGGPDVEAQARLAVLSSTRLGPKSYAVAVTAGGRVLLLGVTEQTVNHLAWLDEPSDGVLLAPDAMVQQHTSAHEIQGIAEQPLPDDYPGSALRAATASNAHLANAQDLARFQKLLQGAGHEPSPPDSASSPASQLAARTHDVLGSTADGLADVTPIVSLRRKRQRRRAAARATRSPVAAPATPGSSQAPFEGQVAGLEALRSR